MDPDQFLEQWLLDHRAQHERARVRAMRNRIIVIGMCIAILAFIAFITKPF